MMSQLASCLKKDFKPFLPNLMEALYRDAKRDLDFKIVDATEEEHIFVKLFLDIW